MSWDVLQEKRAGKKIKNKHFSNFFPQPGVEGRLRQINEDE